MPLTVRKPAVAGVFYPADAQELEALVGSLLDAASAPPPPPVALVAPHAGYTYSGPVAGTAYALVSSLRGTLRRVVLVGPSHHVAFDGMALPAADAMATPLGEHPVDSDGVEALSTLSGLTRSEHAHRLEHSLEVQLPFVHVALGALPVIPLVTGYAEATAVADALERVWTPDTLVVVSSDLSHHLPYGKAREVDAATARAVEGLDAEAVTPERACGAIALRGLLVAARRRGLTARCVDLRNSRDTSHRWGRVVGYGAFGFWAAEA